MAKYVLKQDFSRNYTIDGVTYVHQVYKDDIVDGEVITMSSGTKLRVPIQIGGRVNSFIIPMEMLKKLSTIKKIGTASSQNQSSMEGEETDTTQKSRSSIFTIKSVVMGLVGIAVVYGILKVTKVIK